MDQSTSHEERERMEEASEETRYLEPLEGNETFVRQVGDMSARDSEPMMDRTHLSDPLLNGSWHLHPTDAVPEGVHMGFFV